MDTGHSEKRAQQRCIPPLIQDLLDKFGQRQYDGRGGLIKFLMEKAFAEWSERLDGNQSAVSPHGLTPTK
jgi:hypothetical protein